MPVPVSEQSHVFDQRYTSIQKMRFDDGSEQMIEEEIEGMSNAMTPSAIAGGKVTGGASNTFSHQVMSSAPPSKSYNWQCFSDDRSELLSQSRGGVPDF